MLLGREPERLRLGSLLDAARAGRSAALVLRGEAGIGKSALLDDTARRAEGFLVLRARGFESESELAFSGLADLLQPALGRLGSIPPPQAAALAGALSLGPTVAGDRFGVCAATLSLIAACAEEAPVLVLVDDAQWLDPSSAQAILFATRRLDSEGVAVLVAARPDEGSGASALLDKTGLPALELGGLASEPAVELVAASTGGRPVAPSVAARLAALAAGNPLALIEFPGLLTDAQLAGTTPFDDESATAPTVERAFLQRLRVLPDETREALVVAAASATDDLGAIGAALAAIGRRPTDLDAAEVAEIVSVTGDRLRFRHPLLRAAVLRTSPAGLRRAAHAALADADSRGSDRRAWHLAAAAGENGDEAAAALEDAARETRRRGGYAESASAFERAAELGSDREARARRLRDAASDARLAGEPDRALRLLDRALSDTGDPLQRARIQHLRGAIEMWHGSPAQAHDLLSSEASRVEALDPSRAARMLTDAAWAAFMGGHLGPGLETARRAQALVPAGGGETETNAAAVAGIGLLLAGETNAAVPLLTGYYNRLRDEHDVGALPQHLIRPAGQVLMWFERYDEAREVLTRTIEAARRHSALGSLPYALAVLSELDFRTGRWTEAYTGGTEAVRIAEDTGQEAVLAYGLASLAQVEAARGREDDCRVHAARAIELAEPRKGAAVAFAEAALGALELGLGRPERAEEHLGRLSLMTGKRGLREPGVIHWVPDLVEALVRGGRPDAAAEALAGFETAARAGGRTWALAAVARCRGLLAPDDGFEPPFAEALELHGTESSPFERARTELCLGERLRRARRRSDARAPLRAALEAFERLGAVPWIERTQRELEATGETVRPRSPAAADDLTPTELQIALLVGRGATNKEAGAALFLSPKTIETHLGRVYRKLNVRSRTELAHSLSRAPTLATSGPGVTALGPP